MPSFYIPLSGLHADSTALNTIANNLANMNTTGYKEQTTSFSDLFYQQVGSTGSGDPIQQGSGVCVACNTTNFTSGSISSTDSTSDVAIDGTGFFVLDNDGTQLYTRNGAFEIGSDGTLESSAGLAVMGYTATNGVVNTNGALSDIVIPTGSVMSPSATSTFSVTQNLNSSADIGATASSPITIYDSLGNSYTATVTYTKTAANQWSYNISVPDTLSAATSTSGTDTTYTYNFGSSGSTLATVNSGTNLTITGLTSSGTSATITAPTVTSGESIDDYATALTDALTTAGITNVTVSSTGGTLTITGTDVSTSGSIIQDPVASTNATGTLTFDSSGNLTVPATDVSGITFTGFSDGASAINLSWDLYGSSGTSNISQTASASAPSATSQDGYTSGEYQSFSIDSSGVITAKFSNDQTETIGQLAVATVANEQGLKAVGSTNYATTSASGKASVGAAGTGGRGTLVDSALEASNVDVSSEFSQLIVVQRAFQANSKAVTTFDAVTQDAINMIH
jgi:flagellar hook protein FlgE